MKRMNEYIVWFRTKRGFWDGEFTVKATSKKELKKALKKDRLNTIDPNHEYHESDWINWDYIPMPSSKPVIERLYKKNTEIEE